MASAAFREKNEIGLGAEILIAHAFLLNKWSVCFPCVLSRWDLSVMLNNVTEAIEVKNEENYSTSGNICIETGQGRHEPKRSGLFLSESTFYIHYFGERSLVLRTQPFRRFVALANKGKKPTLFSAADNANFGFVMPRVSFAGHPWVREASLNEIPSAVAYLRQQSF